MGVCLCALCFYTGLLPVLIFTQDLAVDSDVDLDLENLSEPDLAQRARDARHSASKDPASPNAADQPYNYLPMYRHVLQPVVNKTEFKPAADNRELPKAIKKILLPHRYWSVPRPLRPVQRDGLLVWCSYSQLYVMINRNIHGFRCKVSELSLGSCPVSRTTKKYFYFIYGLHECGNKVAVVDGQLAYSNTLRYAPATSQGPVIRSVPFSVPIQCRYNRFHYSYKMGFLPTWPRKQKFFKDLKNKYGFVLIPTDADWTRRAPKTTYYLGQPMYFQATAYIATGGQRLFIHSCYATPTPDHNSKPRFTVIDNFGCMVDSKMDGCGSRFIPYERKDVVRLTVDAFLFQKALSQHGSTELYIHCTMVLASARATPGNKACTYNRKEKRWEEVDGDHEVCTCCDSKCHAEKNEGARSLVTSASLPFSSRGTRGALTTEAALKVEEKLENGVWNEKPVDQAALGEAVDLVGPAEVRGQLGETLAVEQEQPGKIPEGWPDQ